MHFVKPYYINGRFFYYIYQQLVTNIPPLSWMYCIYYISWCTLLLDTHYFFLPGLPKFVLSRQFEQVPQSSLSWQALQSPHLFFLLPCVAGWATSEIAEEFSLLAMKRSYGYKNSVCIIHVMISSYMHILMSFWLLLLINFLWLLLLSFLNREGKEHTLHKNSN